MALIWSQDDNPSELWAAELAARFAWTYLFEPFFCKAAIVYWYRLPWYRCFLIAAPVHGHFDAPPRYRKLSFDVTYLRCVSLRLLPLLGALLGASDGLKRADSSEWTTMPSLCAGVQAAH